MKISGCIITRNEETNIEKCVNSLKHIADEIIVVDTGSEDKTIQIAEELGAIVYEIKWENDFSKAKNAALEHATGDWIIFLDADEYFNDDSSPKIRTAIERITLNRKIEGIQCEIVNVDTDSNEIVSNNVVLRMFRNNKRIRFINRIHEEIRNNGIPLECAVNREISIIHIGYSASLKEKKAKRNLDLLLMNNEDEKLAYYLATTYFILRESENAYKYADIALSVKKITECDYLAYKMHLIKISVALRDESFTKDNIRKLIEAANEKYWNHPEISNIEAKYLLREKLYNKALGKFLDALNFHEKYGETFVQNDFVSSINEVYFNIAYILYLMNKEADALSYIFMALKVNKYSSSAFSSILTIGKTMPETEIIALINSIYSVENKVDLEFVVARVADCGRPKIVLYYASKWNNTFEQEDDVLIYAFLAQGRYAAALEITLIYIKLEKNKYSPLITAVLILGRLFREAELIREEIGEDYFDIVKCFSSGNRYLGSHEAYLSVLSILINHANENVLHQYLNACAEEEAKLVKGIAETLAGAYQYPHSLSYYKRLFELYEDEGQKASAAFQAAYCLYKMNQYEESIDWLERAIQNGYAENDLSEYLLWIAEKTRDDAIKRRTEMLAGMLRTDEREKTDQ